LKFRQTELRSKRDKEFLEKKVQKKGGRGSPKSSEKKYEKWQ